MTETRATAHTPVETRSFLDVIRQRIAPYEALASEVV